MDIRHLVTKDFDSQKVSKALILKGAPVVMQLHDEQTGVQELNVRLSANIKEEIEYSSEITLGKSEFSSSPISECLIDNNEVIPLSQMFDYEVDAQCNLAKSLPIGSSFSAILRNDAVLNSFRKIACNMFKATDFRTGELDVSYSDYFTPYIPLVILTGCMTPQYDNDVAYFNPNGTVSVAEFLDGLNSIKYGCNSNRSRRKSLDNISDVDDYFNEGYQSCIRGISSPFFNLYTREELLKPITRAELAYITVVCWNRYIEKFNSIYGGTYFLGVNFDWENPNEYLTKFEDGLDYQVSKICYDNCAISLNIKDYKQDRTMSEFKEDMKNGISAIPIPVYMSLLELFVLDIFKFGSRLDPLKEVSRGEFCYFLTMLSKNFKSKRIKN